MKTQLGNNGSFTILKGWILYIVLFALPLLTGCRFINRDTLSNPNNHQPIKQNNNQTETATVPFATEVFNIENYPIMIQRCTIETDRNLINLPTDSELIGVRYDGEKSVLSKLTSDFSWQVLPNTEHTFPLGFSPNGEWLALVIRHDGQNDLLRIIDATNTNTEINGEYRLNSNSRWFNDQYLILIPEDRSKLKYLLNPFTGETYPFPNIPNQQIDARFADVYWFDLQGKQVVYLETSESFRSFYSSERFVIYKLETETKIETDLNWVISPPAWFPNGNYLVVSSVGSMHTNRQIPSQEIYIFNALIGETRQISNFFELFGGVFIQNLTWSPNGKYLLFELDLIDDSLPESFEPSLYLLDLQSWYIFDLCLNEVSESSYHWSSDEQMVAWHSESGDLYLLEPETGRLFRQSAPQAGIIGWFASQIQPTTK